VVGDWAARHIAETQPVKLAAIEGLQRTQTGAPFTLGGFYDGGRGEVRDGIEVPKMLSLLAHHDPNAKVLGLEYKTLTESIRDTAKTLLELHKREQGN